MNGSRPQTVVAFYPREYHSFIASGMLEPGGDAIAIDGSVVNATPELEIAG